MSRRKILFLSPRVPFPPNKGDKIRSFHQIDYLAARHYVYCACFVDDERDATHIETVRRWCQDVIAIPWKKPAALWRATAAWVQGRSLTCAAYERPAMRAALAAWADKHSFDVVTAYSSSMAAYALDVPAGRRVLDLCDADSQKWIDYAEESRGPLRWAYRREGMRLREFELFCTARFDATLVITERERAILDPVGADERLHVVSNGVAVPRERSRLASMSGPVIVFVGAMNYRPNVDAVTWFVREVWPIVRRRQPLARFLVVGRDPTASVRRLASAKGVEVLGDVADVSPFLQLARVVVAPLRIARGLQNKVLEAMAMGRPVVTSSAAASCMTAEPGRELIVADLKEDFAQKVVQLLTDDRLCDRVASAGCRRIQRDYDWSRNLREYERIVLGETALKRGGPIEAIAVRKTPTRRFDTPLISGTIGAFRAGKACRKVL